MGILLYHCHDQQLNLIMLLFLTCIIHDTEPDDYTSVNASFIFVNGTSQGGPGSQMCVEIAIRNDSLVEFDEF